MSEEVVYVSFEDYAPQLYHEATLLDEALRQTKFTPDLQHIATLMQKFVNDTASTFEQKQREADEEYNQLREALEDERNELDDTKEKLEDVEDEFKMKERGYKASISEAEEEIRRLKEELFNNDMLEQLRLNKKLSSVSQMRQITNRMRSVQQSRAVHTWRNNMATAKRYGSLEAFMRQHRGEQADFDRQRAELKAERQMITAILDEELAMQQTTVQSMKMALRLLKKEKSAAERRADSLEATLQEERDWAAKAATEYEMTKNAMQEQIQIGEKELREAQLQIDDLLAQLAARQASLLEEQERGSSSNLNAAETESELKKRMAAYEAELAQLRAHLAEVESSAAELRSCWQDAEEQCTAESEAKDALSKELAAHLENHAAAMQKLQDENAALRAEMAADHTEREALEQYTCDTLRRSTTAVRHVETSMQVQQIRLQGQLDAQTNHMESLKQQLQISQTALSTSQVTCATQEQSLTQLGEEKQGLLSNVERLSRQNTDLEADLDMLRQAMETQNLALEESQQQAQELLVEKKHLEEELDRTNMAMQKAELEWECARKKLEDEIALLRSRLGDEEITKAELEAELRRQVSSLQMQVQSLENDSSRLRSENQGLATRETQLRKDLTQREASLAELQAELLQLRTEKRELELLLEQAERGAAEKMQQAEAQLKDLGSQLAGVELQLEICQTKLQEETSSKEQLTIELTTKETQLSEAATLAGQQEADRRALERHVCEGLRQAAAYVKQVETGMQVALIRMLGQYESLKNQLESCQQQLAVSEKALQEANLRCANLENSFSSAGGELEQRAAEAGRLAAANSELEREIERLKSEIKSLKSSLEAETAQASKLLQEKQQLLSELTDVRAGHERDARAWDEARLKLERELSSSATEAKRLQNLTVSLEGELTEARTTYEHDSLEWECEKKRLSNELSELKAALAAMTVEKDAVSVKYEQVQEHYTEASASAAKLERELNSMTLRAESSEAKLADKMRQVSELEEELRKLRQLLRELEDGSANISRNTAATIRDLQLKLKNASEEIEGLKRQLEIANAKAESEASLKTEATDALSTCEARLNSQLKAAEELEAERQSLERYVCETTRRAASFVKRAETSVQVRFIKLQGECDTAHDQTRSLQQQLQTSSAALSDAQVLCATQEQSLAQLGEEKQGLLANVEKLSQQVTEVETECDALRQAMEMQDAALDESQRQVQELLVEKKHLEEELDRTNMAMQKAELEWECAWKKLEEELAALRSRLSAEEVGKAEMEAQLKKKIAELEALLRDQGRDSENEVVRLRAQLQAGLTREESLQRDLDMRDSQIADLLAQVQALQADLRNLEAAREHSEREFVAKVRTLELEISDLKSTVHGLEQRMALETTKLENETTLKEGLARDLTSKEELLSEATVLAGRQESERKALERQVCTVASLAAAAVRDAHRKTDLQVGRLKRQLLDLEERLAYGKQSGDQVDAKLDEALRQAAALREREAELQAMLADTERQLKAWELRHDLAVKAAERERELVLRLQNDLAQLRQKLLQEEGSRIQLEKFIEKSQMSPMPYSPSLSLPLQGSPSPRVHLPSNSPPHTEEFFSPSVEVSVSRVSGLDLTSVSPLGGARRTRSIRNGRSRTPRGSPTKSMPRASMLGEALQTYSGHTSSIMSLSMARGVALHTKVSDLLFTASQDRSARCYNVADGKCVGTYKGHQAAVSAVCVCGSRLFSASHDGTVRQWDVSMATEQQRFTGLTAAQHVSGRHLTSVSVLGEWVYYGCRDREVPLQRGNIATGEVVVVNSGHVDGVAALCASHSCIYSGGLDGNIREWDCQEEKAVRVFAGHSKEVTTLCYWHRQLFSGSRDATIKHWCLNSGRCLKTYVGHLSVVRTVFADEYALMSGSADGTVRVWNTTSGQCEQILQQEDTAVTALALSDNELFTACADGTARKFVIAARSEG